MNEHIPFWQRKAPIGPTEAMVSAAAFAFFIWVLLSISGVSANKAQEYHFQLALRTLECGTGLFLAIGWYILLRRIPSRSDLLFFRVGMFLPSLATLVVFAWPF